MQSQRVKVAVADLLKRVRAARAAAIDAHNESVTAFEVGTKSVRKTVLEALAAETKRLRGGGVPELDVRYGGKVTLELPTLSDSLVPNDPGNIRLDTFDRDIAILEMAADETITISTDSNWGRYL